MNSQLFSLEGKTAVITGGCQGLGLVFAKALADAGANVVITSRKLEKVQETISILSSSYPNIDGHVVDVLDSDQINDCVTQVVEKYGSVDILINNAGINKRMPLLEFDEESWDLIQATNLKAPFLCAKAVAPYMIKQKYGRIINVASMLGMVGLAERAAYCSSKGGLIQLTKVMAVEWAQYNITVNALCPGPFATELNQVVINNPEANQLFMDHLPIKRWGQPEELSGLIVYLASESSSFMTGSPIVIDGGWTAE